ncbi:MAG: hypothetical protein HKN72_07805 [Gemmatimonadetes bacterium]|nr:hypothetical protein [Gemmatimonadota bacterium]NNL29979.1 hypothetical protein [Gemmatimonadota bacterium]
MEIYRADGSTLRVSKSGRAFFDDDGVVVGAIEVIEPLGRKASEDSEPEEARRVRVALERARYNRSAAARSLGVSRTTLWRKMKTYGLLDDEPTTRT